MAQEVPWNRAILEEFADLAMLSETERWLLKTRIDGWTREQQARELGFSARSVDRRIARLKNKYDLVQPQAKAMPPRRHGGGGVWTGPQ